MIELVDVPFCLPPATSLPITNLLSLTISCSISASFNLCKEEHRTYSAGDINDVKGEARNE